MLELHDKSTWLIARGFVKSININPNSPCYSYRKQVPEWYQSVKGTEQNDYSYYTPIIHTVWIIYFHESWSNSFQEL